MPGGKYGPGGRWIHDRAHHIMRKNPDMAKDTAYALATQQAHKVGKSPKSFRTSEGVREAKQKYDLPRREYTKTPNPKTAAALIVGRVLQKLAAGPPPAIPTPQFPAGLQRIAPTKVTSPTNMSGKPTMPSAQTYTQVHSQPPTVGTAPFLGVKSAQPPPATR